MTKHFRSINEQYLVHEECDCHDESKMINSHFPHRHRHQMWTVKLIAMLLIISNISRFNLLKQNKNRKIKKKYNFEMTRIEHLDSSLRLHNENDYRDTERERKKTKSIVIGTHQPISIITHLYLYLQQNAFFS